MRYTFSIIYLSLIVCSCGFSGGSAPNLFGNMRIYITSSTYTGNLGGTSGADAKCMADANYPGEGNFQALLSDGSSRTTATDWVLIAGVKYVRESDGEVIGTTNNQSVFSFPLTNSFITSGSTKPYWSGLKADWTGESGVVDNCQNWTSANSIYSGHVGRAEDTASSAIFDSGTFPTCNTSVSLICVEQ